MITLEKYNVKYVGDFVEFINDFQKNGDGFHMLSIIEDVFNLYFNTNKTYKEFTEGEIREFFPRYVEFILNCETREKIEKKDWIEADSYFICKDGRMIGEIMFRKRLSPYLLKNSLGDIGYKIKHSERGKGYCTQALKLLLNKAFLDGYTELMISCNKNNIASSRVIEKNGGIFNRLNLNSEGGEEKEYWVFRPY